MTSKQPKPKHQEIWEKHLNEYITWMKSHNGELPRNNTSNSYETALHSWMNNNKTRYRKGILEQCRIDRLAPIFDIITGERTNSSIRKEQLLLNNFGTKAGDSLIDKGLSDTEIRRLNNYNIYSVSDIIKTLRELYRISTQYRETHEISNEDREQARNIEYALNIGYSSKDLYTYTLLHEVFKRVAPDIRKGDILLLRSINGYDIDELLFTKNIVYAGISDRIDAALEGLCPREEKILKFRFYGDETGRIMTLSEIGKRFGICGSRVREIQNKALRKLRHPSRYYKIAGIKVKRK